MDQVAPVDCIGKIVAEFAELNICNASDA